MDAAISLLVADDEGNVRSGIAKYIQVNSQRIDKVYTAEDGQQALDAIIQYRPHLMLIDVQMPYKSGLQVIKEAQQMGICPLSVILSGYDEFEYARQALRLGAVDYMLKPCRPADIMKLLESLLAQPGEEAGSQDSSARKNRLAVLATEYIQEHHMDSISLNAVAEHLGISGPYLSTLFNQEIACSFTDYLNRIRVERACSYLYDCNLKTYEVAHRVGFRDEKYFTKVFKKITGISPSTFRNNLADNQ